WVILLPIIGCTCARVFLKRRPGQSPAIGGYQTLAPSPSVQDIESSPMRILYTESSPGWGGQERRIIAEAVEMQRRGHQVLMGLRRGAGIVEPARAAGLEVEEIDFGRKPSLRALIQVVRLIRHKNIELISTHSSA